jgi:uncharacterized membrane protein YsdA (DUF1294 family)/cold shock CspA family protein
MDQLGKLIEWNDARGFGFIQPIDKPTDRVFLHIREYRLMGRRPEIGEVLRYVPQRQQDGRWRAVKVARAVSSVHRQVRAGTEQARHLRSPTTWLPPLLVPAYAALLAWATWSGSMPMPALAALAIINAATWVTYWNDKRAAASNRQRTPESTLHVLELLGGWPAAWLAQETLRHKSRKPSFRWAYLLMAGLNFAIVGGWLLVSRPA